MHPNVFGGRPLHGTAGRRLHYYSRSHRWIKRRLRRKKGTGGGGRGGKRSGQLNPTYEILRMLPLKLALVQVDSHLTPFYVHKMNGGELLQ